MCSPYLQVIEIRAQSTHIANGPTLACAGVGASVVLCSRSAVRAGRGRRGVVTVDDLGFLAAKPSQTGQPKESQPAPVNIVVLSPAGVCRGGVRRPRSSVLSISGHGSGGEDEGEERFPGEQSHAEQHATGQRGAIDRIRLDKGHGLFGPIECG